MKPFSYKELFKKLIDLDMSNVDLIEKASVSKTTFYKRKNWKKHKYTCLIKICSALDCDISDIVEIIDLREEV